MPFKAYNGTSYSENKGFIPEMIEGIISGRKSDKNEMLRLEKEYELTHDESLIPKISMYNNRQMAKKVVANSLFGAFGNEGFHFYDYDLASAITLTGQHIIKEVSANINAKLNSILKTENQEYDIYQDTDSCYINCEDLVNAKYPNKSIKQTTDFLDKFAESVIQPVINNTLNAIITESGCQKLTLGMKREAIASKVLFRAKKNYAMYVHNSEGVAYDPPKLKVQGLEIVRASTPKACKKWLKECLQMMFENTEMEFRDRYLTIKDEFYKLNPEEISFPRGLNDMDKWADKKTVYKKKTPIHVRGALLYNKHIEEDALNNSDKIKFCYLKVPNTIRENVISYPTAIKFPESLVKFIDKDTMFEKTFASPLRSLTDPAGWQLEEVASLEDFFG